MAAKKKSDGEHPVTAPDKPNALADEVKGLKRVNASLRGENTKLRSKINDLNKVIEDLKIRVIDCEVCEKEYLDQIKDLYHKIDYYKEQSQQSWLTRLKKMFGFC